MKVENIAGARLGLGSLVSRDASALSTPLVAAAAIESVAENTTDSYIGPWLVFALFGLPGAFAYRALNTLDSMVGYRGRYEYLGKASARLDDVVNLVPGTSGCHPHFGSRCTLPPACRPGMERGLERQASDRESERGLDDWGRCPVCWGSRWRNRDTTALATAWASLPPVTSAPPFVWPIWSRPWAYQ